MRLRMAAREGGGESVCVCVCGVAEYPATTVYLAGGAGSIEGTCAIDALLCW